MAASMLPVAPPTSTTSIESGKIVSRGDRRGLFAMDADHRFAEQGRVLGMLREVVEERHSLRFLKTGLTCLN
jgi:hypothetical protein